MEFEVSLVGTGYKPSVYCTMLLKVAPELSCLDNHTKMTRAIVWLITVWLITLCNFNFLILIIYYGYVRCYHWGSWVKGTQEFNVLVLQLFVSLKLIFFKV